MSPREPVRPSESFPVWQPYRIHAIHQSPTGRQYPANNGFRQPCPTQENVPNTRKIAPRSDRKPPAPHIFTASYCPVSLPGAPSDSATPAPGGHPDLAPSDGDYRGSPAPGDAGRRTACHATLVSHGCPPGTAGGSLPGVPAPAVSPIFPAGAAGRDADGDA